MKILFAADTMPYSEFALQELINLAENTFAGITIVGVAKTSPAREVQSGVYSSVKLDDPLIEALDKYREIFLNHWEKGESPYEAMNCQYEWLTLRSNMWEQIKVCRGSMKDLNVRVRFGNVVKEILAESKESGSDLIILGCTKGTQCLWEEVPNVPEKVVNEAECSVFLVKEAHPINKIYACLDETNITQESLEMINQMATIHSAGIELIGLTKGMGIKADVYPWLEKVFEYLENKGLDVALNYREISDFEPFIRSEVKEGLLALWMGKKSLLDRFFSKSSIGRFIKTCRTSVLVLR